MKNKKIVTFFHEEMVHPIPASELSQSPLKPKLLMEYLSEVQIADFLTFNQDFPAYERNDFLLAHEEYYVDGFFAGESPYCDAGGFLGIEWSQEYAKSVCYTNSSLYEAISHSIRNPEDVAFSPTSGFHHASPEGGASFCSFSGQVLASTKIYRELGLVGAYVDLDCHFGNSIEDSRVFVEDLNKSIPKGYNVNINAHHEEYISILKDKLKFLKNEILEKRLHYVVFCHGADSHEEDDLGGYLTTDEWIECSTIFYIWINEVEDLTGECIPLTLSLFGGYRKDDFKSVLSLHTFDLVECLNILCTNDIHYTGKVLKNSKKVYKYC